MKACSTQITVRVRYAETDQMGVVYHSHYLVWCEIGRTEHMRALGTTYRDLERSGVKLAVAEATVRFHSPARYDDLVSVETAVDEVGSRAVTFSYLLTHVDSGARLATARTMLIAIDGAGGVVRLPMDIRRLLERGLAPAHP